MPDKKFTGSTGFTPLPNEFFHEWLNEIDDLDELKVTLFALWFSANQEGGAHPIWEQDFAEGLDAVDIDLGLKKCVQRGSLLKVTLDADDIYFISSPRGRAAAESARAGEWVPSKKQTGVPVARHNIYRLYEENIGPLTPMIADTLKDAEEEYTAERIEKAFAQAVKANVRKWNYVEAILKRWKEEGYGKKQNRQDSQEDRNRYVEGDYADFID
jgi:DnaD/phage-associated family protein